MSDSITPGVGLRGVIHSDDPNIVLGLRKHALALRLTLEGYSRADDVVAQVRLGDVALVVVDFGDDPRVSLELTAELSRVAPTVPVLAILPKGAADELKSRTIRSGVRDLMTRPVGPDEFLLRVRNAIRSAPSVFSVARETARREGEMRDTIAEVFEGFAEMLRLAGDLGEWRDTDTGLHITRVAYYSRLMAQMLGSSIEEQDLICHSSTLHDIGKVAVPDQILHKPGPLDPVERKTMEVHAVRGHDLLKRYRNAYLLNGAMIALTHHERWDGNGYPMGLVGREIPMHGRIVCVADVFDALTTRRPYKEPWSLDRAFSLLADESGKQFDPDLVEAFVNNEPRVEQIYRTYADPESATEIERSTLHSEITYQTH